MSVILSVDSGGTSGYALSVDGTIEASGEFRIYSKKGLHRARCMVESLPDDAVMVVEDIGSNCAGMHYKTTAGIGKAIGMWITLARLNDVPYTLVHPNEWQLPMIGGGNRDARKAKSIALASRRVPHTPKDNEADAINIATWAWIKEGNGGDA